MVYESVRTVFHLDETKPFFVLKPLYCTVSHLLAPS
jgi:hypothetical protein